MDLQNDLKVCLDEIIDLLNSFNEDNWSVALATFKNKMETSSGDTQILIEIATDILRIYAGMGSFSDLVLYNSDGQVAQNETAKLDQLRSDLFATALSIKA